jgi:hypothetical protein
MAAEIRQIETDTRWGLRALTALERTIPKKRKKEFVHFMFASGFWDSDKLTFDAAVTRVNECLRTDPDKRQFFKLTEIWAWMKHSGEHALFQEMGADLHYRVDRIPTNELVAELLSRIDGRLIDAKTAFDDAASLRSELVAITSSQHVETAGEQRPVRFSRPPEWKGE